MKFTMTRLVIRVGLLLPALGASADQATLQVPYPPVYDTVLDNGLRVMLIEHREQPTLSLRLLINSGRMNQPYGKEGLAEMMIRLFREGTAVHTSEQISHLLAAMAARYHHTFRDHYMIIGLSVLTQHADPGIGLFADMTLRPSFSSRRFKRIRRNLRGRLNVQHLSSQTMADKHLRALHYGPNHPLGRPVTTASLRRIKVKDVKAFYRDHMRPDNATLVVIGDFSEEQILTRIKSLFGSWHVEVDKPSAGAKTPSMQIGRIRLVHKPKATQAVIAMNQRAIGRGHPDYEAYRLMNFILGGSSFSSRLMSAIRSEEGKTYAVWSQYVASVHDAELRIGTMTRNHECLETIKSLRSEIERLAKEGVTEQELEKAKAYYAGSIPLRLEHPGAIAQRLLVGAHNGLTVEDLRQEINRLHRVTLNDINRVIKTHLLPDHFNLVIVGDTQALQDPLGQIGRYERVGITDYF